ncbi:MAG: VIT1/CCC1 transporter family protein [Nigerium sp.]|nr:VIT1/CCC1 transporter family protein [Nigerium sp.]
MTAREPGSWRSRLTPDYVRSRVADTNDGVLAIAGLSEGLSLTTTQSIGTIVALAAIAGAVSVAGVKYSEEAAEREVQQDLIREEQRLLELSPEEEMAELAQHFQHKGLTPGTARKVAEELSAADALTAQLETEYGIHDIMTVGRPFTEALGSGAFFLLGALVPVLIAILAPRAFLGGSELLGVVISLTLTSVVLSRLTRTRVLRSVARSLLIGVAAMGTATLIGTLAP